MRVVALCSGGKDSVLALWLAMQRGHEIAHIVAMIPRREDSWMYHSVNIHLIDLFAECAGFPLVKAGQRRGNFYVRVNPERNNEIEIFDPFGVKAFSSHGEIERALAQRGFRFISTISGDWQFPVANLYRFVAAGAIAAQLYLWRLETIAAHAGEMIEKMRADLNLASMDDFLKMSAEEIRTKITKHAVKEFSRAESELVESLAARNAELAYVAIKVSKFLGVDIARELKKAFELKEEADEETGGELLILRDLLIDKIKESSDPDGWTLPQQDVLKEFNAELKLQGLKGVSNYRFKRFLRELGFRDGITIKRPFKGEKRLPRHLFFGQIRQKNAQNQ